MWMPPNTLNKMSKYNNTIKAAFLLHFFRGQIISMPYLKIFHWYSCLVTSNNFCKLHFGKSSNLPEN